jgi:hypothetical protein
MNSRADRHLITPGTRLYCVGTVTRPCPAHAWWYHEGRRGRPRLRCDVCRHVRVLEANTESASATPRERCACCGRAVPCLCGKLFGAPRSSPSHVSGEGA